MRLSRVSMVRWGGPLVILVRNPRASRCQCRRWPQLRSSNGNNVGSRSRSVAHILATPRHTRPTQAQEVKDRESVRKSLRYPRLQAQWEQRTYEAHIDLHKSKCTKANPFEGRFVGFKMNVACIQWQLLCGGVGRSGVHWFYCSGSIKCWLTVFQPSAPLHFVLG